MSKIDVRTVSTTEDRKLPIFQEMEDIADRIRIRAFNLFRNRGRDDGNDVDDWLMAEREICWPEAELIEDDDEYEINIALAGFEPGDIEVTATPHELIVKASHETASKRTAKGTDGQVRFSEFRGNEVFRRFPLPTAIDVDSIEAEFENGLLEIEADKAKDMEMTPKGTGRKKIKVRKSD